VTEGFGKRDLERNATLIVWDGQSFVYRDVDFSSCRLELDRAPSVQLFDRILNSVGSQAKVASVVETPFERIAPQSTLWWQGSSADGLEAPVGLAGARKTQWVQLGQGIAQHALVVGRTGSGKSTLLHALVTALALAYSPYELELYLVDFKKGVEFKVYATHSLPHARVVAIESEREFGLSVCQGLDNEIHRRGELFRSIGADHISDYRTRTGKPLPRILLVVDEFQELFVEDDSIASQASQILDRLVRQGRAFGIHVLLGSQTLAGAYTPARSTISQMAVRIALQCEDTESRLILAEDNPAARQLSRPGQAIYNASNGSVEGNSLFQVAWLPGEKHIWYLKRIRAMAQDRRYVPPQAQIVFEGNAPAAIQGNSELSDLLLAANWPARTRTVSVWLGEPIAIKEPTCACLRRQSGSNLLIVGQNDEAAAALTLVSLVGLAAQHKPHDANFRILDLSQVDAPYAGLLDRVGGSLPHSVQVFGRPRLAEVVAETAAEVEERMKGGSAGKRGDVFLVLFGIQRARDLRQDDEFSYSKLTEERRAPSPAEQFNTILMEGPDVGVFAIAWCDTYANLMRTIERRTLRAFAMRVVFQMGAEDSSNLIDSTLGNKLGPHRALYFCEDDGRLEKFRPYSIPTGKWLAWVGEQLRKRESM
jgi:DNA segregation ATPase FtsK/SpoIIIE, S-DNA-T family